MGKPRKQHYDVFISSTSIDLPEYRQAVIEALLGIGLFPSGMEHWPVADENPVDFCHQKIKESELYIGIYAHRYGWRPEGPGTKSITELEYDWAGELGIPRFCFVMDENHPWPLAKMELDAKADLDAFKARVNKRIRGIFTTPENLKAQVLTALAPYAQKQDLSGVEPYLSQLHHDAMQSGLLRTLDPRTKDPNFHGGHVTVDQVYTPLDTRQLGLRDEAGEFKGHESRMAAMEAASHYDRLVVLGDPGSGKSTFVNFLALGLTGHRLDPKSDWLDKLRAQGWAHDAPLPLHVTLRNFAQDMGDESIWGTVQSLLQHIEHLIDHAGCAEAMTAVRDTLRRGDALLILDGLDEVPAERRTAMRDTVTAFMSAYPCRVLITCRILSYADPAWQIPDTETITLAPFDDDKIAHFVAAWYTASAALGNIDPAAAQERTNDLQTAVNDVGLRDMASNPMLLTVMAIVHNHRGTLTRETARLYHECVDLLMLRWRPHDARDLKDELGVQDNDLYSALWKLAYDAHENQAEREGTADISEAEVVFALRDKLGGLDNAARFCNYVEERAGLLYGRGMDAKGARIFTFPHRTFQEYLAGCHIASSSRAFNRVVGEKARQGEKWRQVLLLATGQTVFINNDAERPIDAVQHLLRAEPTDEEGWRAVWLAGDMLLLIGLQRVEADEVGQDVLPLARTRLAALVSKSHLDPIERAAAGRMLAQLGDPRPGVGLRADGIPDIDWVEIPAGEFLMGSDSERDSDARNNETPQRSVYLPTYMISRYPITYAQFTAFVESDGYTNRDYWTEAGWEHKGKRTTPYLWNDPQWHIANHPVVGVTWYEAYAFTKWLNELVQQGRSVGAGLPTRPYEVRLPTEAEWEKAAHGPDGLIYPYGDKFDATKGSARETGIRRTSAVGIFPDGASPYGVLDMSGNVWEWGLTKWRSSYDEPEENDSAGTARRVLRGGSWYSYRDFARAVYRYFVRPSYGNNAIGFRVVVVRPPSL